jgi:hypothetical protein
MIRNLFLFAILFQTSVLSYAAPDIERPNKNSNSDYQNRASSPKDDLPGRVNNKPEPKSITITPNSSGRCVQINSMLTKRVLLLEDNLNKRLGLISKIETNLTVKLQTLKLSGKDTTTIESNLQNFIAESQKLTSQRQELISNLKTLISSDCDNSPSNFQANLREFNQKFRNQNLEFNRLSRDFRVTILVEINNLLSQSNE